MGNCIDAKLLKESTPNDLLHLFRYYWGRGFVTPDDEVLEIGYGSGYGTYALSQVAKKVTAYEILTKEHTRAEEKYGMKNNKFLQGNVEEIELPMCDVATAFEVIEHLYKPYEFIQKLKKVTRKFIIMSVPIEQKLIMVDGDPQVDGDPTHHSVFPNDDIITDMFLDDNWRTFYRFRDGITFFGSFYNINHLSK